jgi:hypothetical protein
MHHEHKTSDKRVEEFRGIYREVFGKDITPQEASQMIQSLVSLYRVLREQKRRVSSSAPAQEPPPAQSADGPAA